MKLSSLILGGVVAVAVIAVLMAVLGVSFHTPTSLQGAALYDPSKEIKVQGTVTGVEEFDCPVSEGELGVHLTLKTTDGTFQVHLAPSRILQGQRLAFVAGDQVQVLGSQVRVNGKKGIIVRELVRGRDSYIFRDPAGNLLMVQ